MGRNLNPNFVNEMVGRIERNPYFNQKDKENFLIAIEDYTLGKTRYSKPALAFFEKVLIKEKERVLEANNISSKNHREAKVIWEDFQGEKSADRTNEAMVHQEYAVATTLLESSEEYKNVVIKATKKRSPYGVCSISGELISPLRLFAKPFTTKCIGEKAKNGSVVRS